MESNYNSENFERLLRESSDQYRMYPSESVWKNVYNALHTRRRWFSIGFTLLLSAGFVTAIMMLSPVSDTHQTAEKKIPASSVKEAYAANESDKILLAPSTENISSAAGKDKMALYQSQPIAGDDRNDNLTGISDGIAYLPVNRESAYVYNTDINIPGIIIENPSSPIINKIYSPVTLVFSDAATDQDSWIMKNGRGLNHEMIARKSLYNIQTAHQPLTIESVINSYTRRNKKLSFQFYFTPTISYRKLSENKSYLRTGTSPNTASVYNNINNVVTHKPDMGVELGVAARYAIGKKIKLRGGLQFNTSRYDIKAFSYAAEVTTIALNTGTYIADSVNTISSYRNFNGYKSDWLHNFYFQISAPIGIEMRLAGDDKIQFGIGSTIQPTYILGDRAYLLSSNYKNYAEVPSLMRRWNMNASFEAFVSYSTGRMNWQVGPQIRYQLQSSFVKEYPVKENLFDFGLKIGVSANK